MDILENLQSGHSKQLTNSIVGYIGNDSKKFAELVDVFLKGDYRISQRAAWSLSIIGTNKPDLIKPYEGRLIKKLQGPGHPAIARNILRIFEKVDVSEKYQAQLIDICFSKIGDPSSPIAIRAFAITTAQRICKHYPELANEFKIILKEVIELPQTPAVTYRIKKALKDLSR